MVGLFNRREVHSVESARLQTQANYLPSLLSLSSAVYRPPLITPMQLPRPQTLNENAICRCSVNPFNARFARPFPGLSPNFWIRPPTHPSRSQPESLIPSINF